MNYQEAIKQRLYGDISVWHKWIKKAKKIDILNAIEYGQGLGWNRHDSINEIRYYLEDK